MNRFTVPGQALADEGALTERHGIESKVPTILALTRTRTHNLTSSPLYGEDVSIGGGICDSLGGSSIVREDLYRSDNITYINTLITRGGQNSRYTDLGP